MPGAPPETETPAPKKRVFETPRASIRRRVLLVLLFTTTLPGYFALLLLWITVSQALENNARQETIERSRSLALELDRHITERLAPFHVIASDPAVAGTLRSLVERYELGLEDNTSEFVETLFQRPPGFEESPVFLVGPRGSIIGQVTENRIAFKFARPTPLDGTGAFDHLSEGLPDRPFAIEPATQDWSEPILVVGAPLATAEGAGNASMALVTTLPLKPIFQSVERQNSNFGQRLVVVSRRSGTIYTTQADDDFQLGLNRIRLRLFETPNSDDLIILPIRGQNLGLAGTGARAIQQLSMDQGASEAQWMVVQAVDLDESLATIRPMFWAAIIIGLVLTVFALVLATMISGRMVRPILRLTEGMEHFSRGKLDYRVDVQTGDELEVLARAANEMAGTLRTSYNDLAQRMAELDDKARQLELIHSISYSVNRVLDLEQLFERIIREMLRQIPCERISLAILNEKRDGMRLDFVYPDDRRHLPRGSMIPMSDSVMGRALKDQALTLRRLRRDGKFYEDGILFPLGMNVLCVVPLIANNGPVGTLNLAAADPELFSSQRIKLLERIADTLALAVEHGRLFSRVARFAEELEETVEKRTAELQAAQARLVQTEKFAATGSIAAHIGHEVNNPLSIIKNYLRILTGRAGRQEPTEEDYKAVRDGLGVIEEEIDRIARIISQLRQVSKPTKAQPSNINVPVELRKMTDLFQGTMHKRNITLELDIDETIGTVRLVGDFLRQIVINFVRNSMDAMEAETGGIITLRARRDHPRQGTFSVEVMDTGTGIPEEVLNKIFDPFFTTKGEGKGTGLGLSVSFNLAQAMGGTIEADSVGGEGTTMRLILPLESVQDSENSGRGTQSGTEGPGDDGQPPVVRRRGRKIIIG
ncbi:MAG: two-component system, NtrC family, sensor kinase [Candidatus Sumerlaeota bacterium]|nr:two-component system, NtrC family, sensor kinase [Candidatus Sumerlaeota bacterium]